MKISRLCAVRPGMGLFGHASQIQLVGHSCAICGSRRGYLNSFDLKREEVAFHQRTKSRSTWIGQLIAACLSGKAK